MKPYADVNGYPAAVMKVVAGNAEECLDSVLWNLDESAEHDLVRRVQNNTINECLHYRTAHAVELPSLKLDDKSRSEYRAIQDQLKAFDEERLADVWLKYERPGPADHLHGIRCGQGTHVLGGSRFRSSDPQGTRTATPAYVA